MFPTKYWVATISGLLEIKGLLSGASLLLTLQLSSIDITGFFCKILSLLQGSFAKETYDLRSLLVIAKVSFAKDPYQKEYILQREP